MGRFDNKQGPGHVEPNFEQLRNRHVGADVSWQIDLCWRVFVSNSGFGDAAKIAVM